MTPSKGVTPDEQKRSPGFSGKNRVVTPSVAAPGVTQPSDATALFSEVYGWFGLVQISILWRNVFATVSK